MSRVIVYIDGFNLYHAIDELSDPTLKWVDLWSLSEGMLKSEQTLARVKYFSAFATWRPDSYKRHREYVAALRARGVEPIMGQFKKKFVTCKSCRTKYVTHEEKETDVNIGVHLVADALRDRFDTAIVLSADTDLAAAIKLARAELNHSKNIIVASPPGRFRRARELRPSFEVTKGRIRASLLPDELVIADGRLVRKPTAYT